jgi:TatD DNase family protein
MRTVTSAASDVANQDVPPEAFYDALLRNSKGKVVEPPDLGGAPIADTHAHLDMLHRPELALARAAALGVNFIVSVIDPSEDPHYELDNLSGWLSAAGELLGSGVLFEDDKLLEGGDSSNAGGRAMLAPTDACTSPFVGVRPLSKRASGTGSTQYAECYPGELILRTPGTSIARPSSRECLQPMRATTGRPYEGRRAYGASTVVTAPTVRLISGCHPHNASKWSAKLEATLREVLADERCVGLGEIGLDYHYDNSPRDVQREVFRLQIRMAHELDLPIALHLREAHADGLAILREEGLPSAGTLLHCFNLDYATLEPFLELGCYVAFGGPVTFNKADEVRDAASRTPLERIVSETDCPFMAPHPIRGTICEPASIVFTVARLANNFADASQIYKNALRFFRQNS